MTIPPCYRARTGGEKAFRAWMGDEEETVCDREGSEVEQIDVEPTRAGILHALQRYGSHNDNG